MFHRMSIWEAASTNSITELLSAKQLFGNNQVIVGWSESCVLSVYILTWFFYIQAFLVSFNYSEEIDWGFGVEA